jgi:hypothetical protein
MWQMFDEAAAFDQKLEGARELLSEFEHATDGELITCSALNHPAAILLLLLLLVSLLLLLLLRLLLQGFLQRLEPIVLLHSLLQLLQALPPTQLFLRLLTLLLVHCCCSTCCRVLQHLEPSRCSYCCICCS